MNDLSSSSAGVPKLHIRLGPDTDGTAAALYRQFTELLYTLTFAPGDIGFGPGRFYTTGTVNPTWQSVSFAAIADRAIGAGSFTVTPSAAQSLASPFTLASPSPRA